MLILALDDDPETLELVAGALARDGHETVRVENVRAAREVLARRRFDVLVFDVMLGRESGLELCTALRNEGLTTPILFLSARGTVGARVDGLDAGADDYLPKPFAVRELVARVRALGRRGPSLRVSAFRTGAVAFDFARRSAKVGKVEIPFTAREWEVLRVLAEGGGRIVPFDEILERAWGEASEGARHSLGVLVTRVRKKLEAAGAPNVVRTMRGLGYTIDQEET